MRAPETTADRTSHALAIAQIARRARPACWIRVLPVDVGHELARTPPDGVVNPSTTVCSANRLADQARDLDTAPSKFRDHARMIRVEPNVEQPHRHRL